jgi:hypothetical protein
MIVVANVFLQTSLEFIDIPEFIGIVELGFERKRPAKASPGVLAVN